MTRRTFESPGRAVETYPELFVKNNLPRAYAICLRSRVNAARLHSIFAEFRNLFRFPLNLSFLLVAVLILGVSEKPALCFHCSRGPRSSDQSSGKREKCIAVRKETRRKATIRVVKARWWNCTESALPDPLFQPCFRHTKFIRLCHEQCSKRLRKATIGRPHVKSLRQLWD